MAGESMKELTGNFNFDLCVESLNENLLGVYVPQLRMKKKEVKQAICKVL